MSRALDAETVIRLLGLVPHPREGGWFIETYRSGEGIHAGALPARYGADRAFGTAIYYLLTPGTRSVLHRLASDEVFHHYLGDPVVMLNLHADRSSRVISLGPDIATGQVVQHVVPRDVWQGAHLADDGRWALLGCTVAPGFDYADYAHGDRDALLRAYPDRADLIRRLT